MSMNIKNPEAHRLARELAAIDGVSVTEAVTEALRSAVEARLEEQFRAERNLRLHEILERCAERLKGTSGPSLWEINESLWDEAGLPQ
jgi:antitoxin VapB